MSMLAEPRRKQKVINLRAKNNAWSNDSTKFGQRMLEKMGWSSGKGLGANENGIVEHVVAKYKNDDRGLGFEDRNDQWTKHEDDFNSLLANLSNAGSPEGPETLHSGISLEKKSKNSKARIHYHKFTRGKDLSRYSDKDLANIFGKKSFKEPETEECIKEDILKTTEQVFTEKGNMNDYFKSKLAALKLKSKLLNNNSNSTDGSDYGFQGFSNSTEPESDQNRFGYQPFSFYSSQKEDISQNYELTCQDVETKSKKKKKSKVQEILSKMVVEENDLQKVMPEMTEEILTDVESTKVKKSKNKKHVGCIEKTQSLLKVEESNLSECQDTTPKEQILMDIESTKVKKSKKKKHKEFIEETKLLGKVGESYSSEYTQEVIQDVRKKEKKKSKKKKYQECLEDETDPCEEISKIKEKSMIKNHIEDIQEHLSPEHNVPKKKKKRKNQDL